MIHIETDKNYNIIYKTIYLPCDDHIELLKVEKIDCGDNEIEYNIAIVDSCSYNKRDFLNRIKRAFKVLFGIETYYGDIVIKEAKMRDFLTNMSILVNEEDGNGTED